MTGNQNFANQRRRSYFSMGTEILFPLLLFLFPLLKLQQGVDLTDTPYSLGNYRFFGEAEGVWVLSTFLSNAAGFLLTKLPMGDTLLGMKLYTSLIVSFMALFSYRFFKTKMPSWVAFAGELAAVGFCWCPTGILYNYMTYLFFLMGAVLVFRGLAGSRPLCLFLAGVCLGLNVSVRTPNVLEAALILAVWYYGIKKKKAPKAIGRDTGLCIGGFLLAQGAMFGVISLLYGIGAYGEMISGLLGMAGSASDYTPGEMLLSILSAYRRGLAWMAYMVLCMLPGIPFLAVWKGKYEKLRKVVYCLCIPLLFFALYKWGMFNFRYYQKESGLQWGVIFLIVSICCCLWMLFTKMLDDEWKLIGCISLIIILATPLGSNNYVWPALNNLFFTAPVTFWMIYRFARWGRPYLDRTGRVPVFAVKAMTSAMVLMFFVQSMGLGIFYVFLDGETGEKRNSKVMNNAVLQGMYTTSLNAETIDELSIFMTEHEAEFQDKELILYGNIPGLSYYLDKPSAVFTSWPDLDTNSKEQLAADLEQISKEAGGEAAKRPLVILTPALSAFLADDKEAMEWFGTDRRACEKDEKLGMIGRFMEGNGYRQAFANEAYVVYE